jgi:hypothetical protein
MEGSYYGFSQEELRNATISEPKFEPGTSRVRSRTVNHDFRCQLPQCEVLNAKYLRLRVGSVIVVRLYQMFSVRHGPYCVPAAAPCLILMLPPPAVLQPPSCHNILFTFIVVCQHALVPAGYLHHLLTKISTVISQLKQLYLIAYRGFP